MKRPNQQSNQKSQNKSSEQREGYYEETKEMVQQVLSLKVTNLAMMRKKAKASEEKEEEKRMQRA